MGILVEKIFDGFHGAMSSWNNYKELSNAYTDKCSRVYAIAQNLKDCGRVCSVDTDSGPTAHPSKLRYLSLCPTCLSQLFFIVVNASC